jgi:hypothetical protein
VVEEPSSHPNGEGIYGADINARNILNQRRTSKNLKRKAEFEIGDKVKIKTVRFGRKYSKGLPEYTEGRVVKIKGKKASVVYEGGEEAYDTNLAHLEKLDGKEDVQDGDVVATVNYKGKWY